MHHRSFGKRRLRSLVVGLLFLVAVAMSSCSSEGNIPPATGITGDIYLIMDSAQWRGQLGAVMDSVFGEKMLSLPRPEPIFHMIWIDPRKLNYVLKQRRNLIFAFSLDKKTAGTQKIKAHFTPESLSKISSDSTTFNVTKKNVYATNQEVLYLFANTETQLIQLIRKNGRNIVDHFNTTEKQRMLAALKKGNQSSVSKTLSEKMACNLTIPFGYKVVESNDEFFWLRQINPYVDKDIFIARKPYISEKQFSQDSLIQFRNAICRKYLFEDPERLHTYLTTETDVAHKPIRVNEVNFNDLYAVEMRGLWKTNNLTMGGPFVGYAMVNSSNNTFYYIEGFTYGPSRPQREVIRELETAISTFSFPVSSNTNTAAK